MFSMQNRTKQQQQMSILTVSKRVNVDLQRISQVLDAPNSLYNTPSHIAIKYVIFWKSRVLATLTQRHPKRRPALIKNPRDNRKK